MEASFQCSGMPLQMHGILFEEIRYAVCPFQVGVSRTVMQLPYYDNGDHDDNRHLLCTSACVVHIKVYLHFDCVQ